MKHIINRYLSFIINTSHYALKVLVLILLIFSVGSVVSFLNRQRYLEIHRSKITLTNISHDSGNSYVANIGRSDLSAEYQVSSGLLVENGIIQKGLRNADINYVRQVGKGSSLFWKDKIYFASSDNKDPRIDGKLYEISYPVIIRYYIAYPVYLITVLLLLHVSIVMLFKPAPVIAVKSALWQYITFNERIITRCVNILLVVSFVLSSLIYLNQNGILVFHTNMIPLTNVTSELGYAFYSDVRSHNIKWDNGVVSLVYVLENGKPLTGPSNAQHSQIRETGQGAFSYWAGYLYFSSSDNTSPILNGRSYHLVYPVTLDSRMAYLLYAVTCVVFVVYCFLCILLKGSTIIQHIRDLLIKRQFSLSIVIIVIAYVIPRSAWFVDYQVPLLAYDTPSYFAIIEQYLSGAVPLFHSRTIGYPAFLLLLLSLSKSLISVVVVQSVITLLSSIVLLVVIRLAFPSFTLLSAFAIASHVAQPMLVELDFYLLTESIYSSVLLQIIAMIIMIVKKKIGGIGSILLSINIALAILIRPSSMYLTAIYMFMLLFMLKNKYAAKYIWSLLLPFPLIIGLYLAYNNYTLGKYSISFLGNGTLFAVTSYIWEPSSSLPPEINKNIISRFKGEISQNDKEIIEHTWDFDLFYKAVVPHIDRAFYGRGASYLRAALQDYAANRNLADQQVDSLMGKIAVHAIKSHPDIYLKFFLMNLLAYVDDRASWSVNLYNDMSWVLGIMYIDGLVDDDKIKSVIKIDSPNNNVIINKKYNSLVVKPTKLVVLNSIFTKLLSAIYDRNIWTYMYICAYICSLILLIRSRGSNPDIFILFVVSSILFISAVMYAAVTTITDRYPSPTRFIEVFSVLYFVHIFVDMPWFKMPSVQRVKSKLMRIASSNNN